MIPLLIAALMALSPTPLPMPVPSRASGLPKCRNTAIGSTAGQVTEVATTYRSAASFSAAITATPAGGTWSTAGVEGLFTSGSGADTYNLILFGGSLYLTVYDHANAWKTRACPISGTGAKTITAVFANGALALLDGGTELAGCSDDGAGTGVLGAKQATIYVGKRGADETWQGTIATMRQCNP